MPRWSVLAEEHTTRATIRQSRCRERNHRVTRRRRSTGACSALLIEEPKPRPAAGFVEIANSRRPNAGDVRGSGSCARGNSFGRHFVSRHAVYNRYAFRAEALFSPTFSARTVLASFASRSSPGGRNEGRDEPPGQPIPKAEQPAVTCSGVQGPSARRESGQPFIASPLSRRNPAHHGDHQSQVTAAETPPNRPRRWMPVSPSPADTVTDCLGRGRSEGPHDPATVCRSRRKVVLLYTLCHDTNCSR